MKLTPMQAPLGVHALLFDMDDVLYDATVWRRWLLRQLSRLGLHTHYESFFRVWDIEYLPAVHRGRKEFWSSMGDFLMSAGLTRGQVDEVLVASRSRRQELESLVSPLPKVRATIRRCKALGLSMALLCNSTESSQQIVRMTERMGIADCFDFALTSIELGHVKPESITYKAALRSFGLPAANVAFVGHDPAEIRGATEVGMPTIAIRSDNHVAADLQLNEIGQLGESVYLVRQRMAA